MSESAFKRRLIIIKKKIRTFFPEVKYFPENEVFIKLLPRLFISTIYAVISCAVMNRVETQKIPGQFTTVISLVMGLLLVFRTNSAYDRFWEGRKIWSGIEAVTTNMIKIIHNSI
ncbi:UPF0187 protein, partial [Smittium culicis]